jgi:hypothetical protein
VTASAPLEAALPFIGWRGAFWLVAGLAASIAALIFFAMPEKDGSHPAATCATPCAVCGRSCRRGCSGALRRSRPSSPAASWRCRAVGGALADGGEWLQPGAGGQPSVLAQHRHAGGQLSIGAWAMPLAARGIPPLRLMQVGLFVSMVVEALIIGEVGPTLLLWCVLGAVSATGAQMYGVVAGCSRCTSPAG